ncbi:MAG: phospho-N-acetylmuramoyl-pentapeptide-transferase [Candidatus Moranbacteria bacterium]|nr:phospho-N-acetylmuramoyl-pentapeptide-transferase [Candidatus Moranbacteria bacterium]
MEFAQIFTVPLYIDVIKVFLIGLFAFLFSLAWTPVLSGILYKHFRTKTKKKTISGEHAPITRKITKGKEGTPLMGGILVWVTVLVLAFFFYFLTFWVEEESFVSNLNFFSRSQTWLPLFALGATGIIGFFDDYFSTRGIGGNKGGGISFWYRLGWLSIIALAGGLWFYFKLDYNSIHIPGFGDVAVGWFYILYFVFIIIATAFSSNETDGLDGLNGGVLLFSFSAFCLIAFFQERIDLAAFCAAICGGLLAFLWFNIYPARFFMGDTGAFSLGTTLGVVALLTNSSLVLPLISFIYVVEALSVIIQLLSKKLRNGKKVFLAAPIHYHFRAKGWPESKVVMRFWIISAVMAAIGIVIGVLGSG